MHKIQSREISNRKYLSKTILACRERQANKNKLKRMYQRSISYKNTVFTILIGPEVADAWSVGHPIGINIGDINVISNLTYCSDKIIH